MKQENPKKHIAVTGAYGGMGRATVKLLVQMGYYVFALDKSVGEEEEGVCPIAVDVTDGESVDRACALIAERCNKLFAIVHFAGVYRLDSLVEMTEKRFTSTFDVNLFGVYRVNKGLLPLLYKGSRIIITTSELAPLEPLPFTGVYAISKAALEKYAYSLRMELQLLEIKVTVIRPGAVETGLLGDSTRELDGFCKGTELYTFSAEKFKRIVEGVEAKSVPATAVAKKALAALKAKRPRYVYNLNRNPLLRLLNILPHRLQTFAIRQILKSK